MFTLFGFEQVRHKHNLKKGSYANDLQIVYASKMGLSNLLLSTLATFYLIIYQSAIELKLDTFV